MLHTTKLKLELGRGAPDLVSGQIIRLDSGKIVLSCIWPDIHYILSGHMPDNLFPEFSIFLSIEL